MSIESKIRANVIKRSALLSTSALAFSLAPHAVLAVSPVTICADPSTGTVSCTVESGTSGDWVDIDKTFTAGSGNGDGTSAGTYTLTNNNNHSLGGGSQQTDPLGVLAVKLRGGDGGAASSGDSGRGGNGGTITIDNTASLAVTNYINASGGGSTGGIGIYDDIGTLFAIYAAGIGGDGGNGIQGVAGGNGGRGGDGGYTTITNTGAVTMSGAAPGWRGRHLWREHRRQRRGAEFVRLLRRSDRRQKR